MRKFLKVHLKRIALCMGIVLAGSLPVLAGMDDFVVLKVVPNQDLDTMRGGFITDSGLQISLGITKAVFIDGVLHAVSTLNIPRLTTWSNGSHHAQSGTTASSASAIQTAVNTPVSNGSNVQPAGSTAAPAVSNNPIAAQAVVYEPVAVVSSQQSDGSAPVQVLNNHVVLVQNNENQKVIKNMQIYDIAVENSRAVQRAINLSYRINQQMINALH